MDITKIGHCCLVIKENDLTILTDPGAYSTEQDNITGIDVVLITHEHPDHLHIESLKKVLANNPEAEVYTVKGVGVMLDKVGIAYELLEDGQSLTVKNVLIEGFGKKHEEIYEKIPPVDNTGYFIQNRLWFPGDAFHVPPKPVEILALPVAGPWLKISEVVAYAGKIKPKVAFPVHDAGLKQLGLAHRIPSIFLPEMGISWRVIDVGATETF